MTKEMLIRFMKDEEGASAIELGILLLGGVACVAGVGVLGFLLYCIGLIAGAF